MLAYFLADIGWEFVVDIGRQLPEQIHAVAPVMGMAVRRWSGSFFGADVFFLVMNACL